MTSPTWLHITLTALAVSCLIAPGAEPANATPRTITDLLGIQRQVKRILPSAKQATVAILGEGAGTGVIVSPDGLVLTAGHVIGKPGSRLKVILSDGTIVRAKALGTVRFADAGMVRLPKGHYPYVRMATDEVPGMGSWCVALGHPGGPDKKRGPVTRIGRLISQNRHTIRTDCKLIGGDSGGPLLNIRGDIIGIQSRISRSV